MYEAELLQGHSVAGRTMSMKNSSDTIGNQNHDQVVVQWLNLMRHRVTHIYLDITLYPNDYIVQLIS